MSRSYEEGLKWGITNSLSWELKNCRKPVSWCRILSPTIARGATCRPESVNPSFIDYSNVKSFWWVYLGTGARNYGSKILLTSWVVKRKIGVQFLPHFAAFRLKCYILGDDPKNKINSRRKNSFPSLTMPVRSPFFHQRETHSYPVFLPERQTFCGWYRAFFWDGLVVEFFLVFLRMCRKLN